MKKPEAKKPLVDKAVKPKPALTKPLPTKPLASKPSRAAKSQSANVAKALVVSEGSKAHRPLGKTDVLKEVVSETPASKRVNAKAKAPKRPRARLAKPDPKIVHEIFARFQKAEPAPKGELEHVNVFTFLVAVVLSAQATDAGVNKATRGLFAIADTPEKMLALGEEKVRDMIKTIGLFRAKAKNVILLSQMLIEKFGSQIPRTREELEMLPGVGRKTANVVMNNSFGAPTIAVDTHLFRVANRIPLARGKTPLEVELGLEKIIPDEFKQHAHHWLILHGRYVCKARRPECERCIISDLCSAPDKRV